MQSDSERLSTTDHRRDSAGLTYVYPVVSRRAGGVSLGINLNPNNACNWRCIYCQVPNLKRGTAPRINLPKLEAELRFFLRELIHGDFMDQHVPPEARKIRDIALSGNGEPTSAKEFEQVIELIGAIMKDFDLPDDIKLVLITNGSLVSRSTVQAGLHRMSQLHGEVWFKFDRALAAERQRVNNNRISLQKIHDHLRIAASLCPTWIQTCVFQINGEPPSDTEVQAYLQFLRSLMVEKIPIQGVLLYGIARPSLQPEAPELSRVTESWLIAHRERIQALGLPVRLNP
ncbi:radical SAM protein [Nitrosomonas sp. JL21]|uniref:radical SAM protein n=1 Tax=Nitrosomonas sp. JL21 TaxID=153949 RepID=UPI00136CB313|nr:radical SAM protein [Nitrosomonas sp. JL21]MBL8497552.1 radical SAM protein [Nitrosomonas sp.]MXS78623.1 radical SAM protein [Nitrosomonas sp. JL21]